METPDKLIPRVRKSFDERLVFFVRSRSGEGERRVDAEQRAGLMSCDCPAYQFGKRKDCYHIQEARKYLACEVAQQIIKTTLNEVEQNKTKSTLGKSLPGPTQPSGRAVRETPPATAGPVQDWPEDDDSGYVPF
jgi:hypothetical protein